LAVSFAIAALVAARSLVAQDDPATLVGQLASDDAQIRHDAYNKLMRARSPEAMALLAKALPTLPIAGAAFAVYLLEGYPAEDTAAVWKKLAGQDGAFVRAAAAAALWRRGDKSLAQVLAAAVTAALPAERTHVLARLYGIDDPAVVTAVRGLVRKGVESGVVGEALHHLLQWQKGRDVETIGSAEALAADPTLTGDDGARSAIALAYLVAAGEGRHAGPLAARIAEEKLQLFQWTRFLERAPRLDKVLVEAIAARLTGAKSEYDVTRLVQLLQKHAPGRVEQALRDHLDGDDPKLRAAALKALATIPGALEPKKFREMLGSADAQVVLVAAETLRRMDDYSGLEVVMALATKAGKDRVEAVRVLGGFRDPKVVPLLIAAFADPELQVRRHALTGLQQLLPDLFPYRRFDLDKAGCRADGPEVLRAEGLRLLRAWWAAQQPK